MKDVDEFGVVCAMNCQWAHPGRYFLWSAFLASWEHARLACTQAAMRAVDQPCTFCFLTRSTGLPAAYSFTFCLSFSDWHGLSRFGVCTLWNSSAQIAYWLDLGDCWCSSGYSTNPGHWKRHQGPVAPGAYWQEGLEWPSTIWSKGTREQFHFWQVVSAAELHLCYSGISWDNEPNGIRSSDSTKRQINDRHAKKNNIFLS